MRPLRRSALLIATLALALATAASPPVAAQDPDFDNGVSVLFTMAGDNVEMRWLPDRLGQRSYVVTIAEPTNRVTWFTDRPTRDAGTVSLASFLRAWGPVGFHADPPNAAIELTNGVTQLSVPATIANPRLRTDGALVFRATLLDKAVQLSNAPSASVFIDADDGSKEGATWPMPKFDFVVCLSEELTKPGTC